jgi:hypothetical protein
MCSTSSLRKMAFGTFESSGGSAAINLEKLASKGATIVGQVPVTRHGAWLDLTTLNSTIESRPWLG